MRSHLPRHNVVLLGVGHTNAHIVRMWRMNPIPGARLICVSNYRVATYSGMLPGTLAGLYPSERMQIDLVRLTASVGAELIVEPVIGLDREKQRLLFADRPPLPFDVLSVGVGSVPSDLPDGAATGGSVLSIKPMQTFLDRLTKQVVERVERLGERPLKVSVVGAGVAGIEIAFCLPGRLRMIFGERPFEIRLINGGDEIAPGLDARSRALVLEEFEKRGVPIHLGQRVTTVDESSIHFASGEKLDADLVIWATGAAAPSLLANLDLPTDERGFLLTDDTLRTTAGDPVFAVGDTGSIEGNTTPKAGVYAVRQGPILWDNLERTLRGNSLRSYKPQQGFLKLMATGDHRAIMSYRGFAFHAGWCWRLKERIDGRFMDMFQEYAPMEMASGMVGMDAFETDSTPASAPRSTDSDADSSESSTQDSSSAKSGAGRTNKIRCAGCGGKVSGDVLSRVLARLEVRPAEHVLVGLDQPDDAAVIAPPGGRPVTVTADFFSAPLRDMFAVGRIAALNAASDAFALGAQPHSALALVTIPPGPAAKQEQLLFELLSGAKRELDAMGATLVGGHTIEGPETTIGFTILADTPEAPRTKGMLEVGDSLILTKPLGTGALLAGQMQAMVHAAWMTPLLRSMLLSNQGAAELMAEMGLRGMTDVTGFGLAGHLLEMLRSADAAAEIRLNEIPMLPGTVDLIFEGVESSLAPANRAAEERILVEDTKKTRPQYAALFDPQTSGGMLLAAPESKTEALLTRLAEQSDVPAAVIGRVVARESDDWRIRVG